MALQAGRFSELSSLKERKRKKNQFLKRDLDLRHVLLPTCDNWAGGDAILKDSGGLQSPSSLGSRSQQGLRRVTCLPENPSLAPLGAKFKMPVFCSAHKEYLDPSPTLCQHNHWESGLRAVQSWRNSALKPCLPLSQSRLLCQQIQLIQAGLRSSGARELCQHMRHLPVPN